MSVDRRRHPRRTVDCPAYLEVLIGDMKLHIDGQVVNESDEGACFVLRKAFVVMGDMLVPMRRTSSKQVAGNLDLVVAGIKSEAQVRWSGADRVGLLVQPNI